MLNLIPHVSEHASQAPLPSAAEQRKILVVEDEALLALHAEEVLSGAGFLVVAAPNSRIAIRLAQQTMPDLVLMDVRLGRHLPDGVDTAVEIQERFGIPIIFLTANVQMARSPRAAGAKAIGVIAKPYSDLELLRAVTAALYP